VSEDDVFEVASEDLGSEEHIVLPPDDLQVVTYAYDAYGVTIADEGAMTDDERAELVPDLNLDGVVDAEDIAYVYPTIVIWKVPEIHFDGLDFDVTWTDVEVPWFAYLVLCNAILDCSGVVVADGALRLFFNASPIGFTFCDVAYDEWWHLTSAAGDSTLEPLRASIAWETPGDFELPAAGRYDVTTGVDLLGPGDLTTLLANGATTDAIDAFNASNGTDYQCDQNVLGKVFPLGAGYVARLPPGGPGSKFARALHVYADGAEGAEGSLVYDSTGVLTGDATLLEATPEQPEAGDPKGSNNLMGLHDEENERFGTIASRVALDAEEFYDDDGGRVDGYDRTAEISVVPLYDESGSWVGYRGYYALMGTAKFTEESTGIGGIPPEGLYADQDRILSAVVGPDLQNWSADIRGWVFRSDSLDQTGYRTGIVIGPNGQYATDGPYTGNYGNDDYATGKSAGWLDSELLDGSVSEPCAVSRSCSEYPNAVTLFYFKKLVLDEGANGIYYSTALDGVTFRTERPLLTSDDVTTFSVNGPQVVELPDGGLLLFVDSDWEMPGWKWNEDDSTWDETTVTTSVLRVFELKLTPGAA
jgi:hypothetical protein